MNIAAREKDNRDEWRRDMEAHRIANTPRQKRIRLEMEKIEARNAERREMILATIMFVILLLILALCPSCEVHRHSGNGPVHSEIVPPWELDGGLLNPWSWMEAASFKLAADKHVFTEP